LEESILMDNDRNYIKERHDLIQDLRFLVTNYVGKVEDSPHYEQLSRLLVSECILNTPNKAWQTKAYCL
jgi:hypothetical protein